MTDTTDPARPAVDLIRGVSRRYPGVWRKYRDFRAARGGTVPDWPDWCYAPMAAAYAVVSGGGPNCVRPSDVGQIAVVAACAAWRPTQGVYRLDRPLLSALWDQPPPDTVGAPDLTRLPRWCAYVDLQGFEPAGADGLFLHLEHDARDGHAEFRGLYVRGGGRGVATSPVVLDLGGSPAEGARSVVREALRVGDRDGQAVPVVPGTTAAVVEHARPALSIALYLASGLADVTPAPAAPDAGEARQPAAPAPRVHDVA